MSYSESDTVFKWPNHSHLVSKQDSADNLNLHCHRLVSRVLYRHRWRHHSQVMFRNICFFHSRVLLFIHHSKRSLLLKWGELVKLKCVCDQCHMYVLLHEPSLVKIMCLWSKIQYEWNSLNTSHILSSQNSVNGAIPLSKTCFYIHSGW